MSFTTVRVDTKLVDEVKRAHGAKTRMTKVVPFQSQYRAIPPQRQKQMLREGGYPIESDPTQAELGWGTHVQGRNTKAARVGGLRYGENQGWGILSNPVPSSFESLEMQVLRLRPPSGGLRSG
jgi:hypothetical protein